MLELPKTLTKNKLFYEQVKRTDKIAMYSLRQSPGGNIVGYETFLIKVDEEREVFGKVYPEREHFPGNEEFGEIAWSWISREKADADYSGLCAAALPPGGL